MAANVPPRKIIFFCVNFRPGMLNFGPETPILGKFPGKIELLSILSEIRMLFVGSMS